MSGAAWQPHLDAQVSVLCTPFASDLRDIVNYYVLVAVAAQGSDHVLHGLCTNCSHEGGFELPMTAEWLCAIREQNPACASLLEYHQHRRQFRFIDKWDGVIYGLRTKDSLRCWTRAERECLRQCLEAAIAASSAIAAEPKTRICFDEADKGCSASSAL